MSKKITKKKGCRFLWSLDLWTGCQTTPMGGHLGATVAILELPSPAARFQVAAGEPLASCSAAVSRVEQSRSVAGLIPVADGDFSITVSSGFIFEFEPRTWSRWVAFQLGGGGRGVDRAPWLEPTHPQKGRLTGSPKFLPRLTPGPRGGMAPKFSKK